MSQDQEHICEPGRRFAILDARGIFCCYACPECETRKRDGFLAEIFTDPNYETCEDIDG